jgi:hypothetical protein
VVLPFLLVFGSAYQFSPSKALTLDLKAITMSIETENIDLYMPNMCWATLFWFENWNNHSGVVHRGRPVGGKKSTPTPKLLLMTIRN